MGFNNIVFLAIPFLLALSWDRTHRERGAKVLWGQGLITVALGALLVTILPNAGLLYYCGPGCWAAYRRIAIPLSALVVLVVVQGLRAMRSPTWVTTIVGGIVGYDTLWPFYWTP